MKRYLFTAAAMLVLGTAAAQAAGDRERPLYPIEPCYHIMCVDCPPGPIVKPGHPPVVDPDRRWNPCGRPPYGPHDPRDPHNPFDRQDPYRPAGPAGRPTFPVK